MVDLRGSSYIGKRQSSSRTRASGGFGGGTGATRRSSESLSLIEETKRKQKAERFGSSSGFVIVETPSGYKRVSVDEVDTEGNFLGSGGGKVDITATKTDTIPVKQAQPVPTDPRLLARREPQRPSFLESRLRPFGEFTKKSFTEREQAKIRTGMEGDGRFLQTAEKPQGFIEQSRRFLEQKRQASSRSRAEGKGTGFVTGISDVGIGLGLSGVSTLELGKSFKESPLQTSKDMFAGLRDFGERVVTGKGFPDVGKTLKTEPGISTGIILGEVIQAKAFGKAAQKTAQFGRATKARLSPGYIGVQSVDDIADVLKVPSKTPGKTVDIKVTKTGFKAFSEPIKVQVKRAGKTVDVVSAQRDLFKMLEGKKVVNKPLPTPDAPPLEKAFFGDPSGRLRPSRLGLTSQPEASLVESLVDDVTFRKPKPQALVFEQQTIQKFPKTLKNIEKKLLSGKTLTPTEAEKLVKFQLKPSGKFKTPGFLSGEPEVVLAPGEVITKEKLLGVTVIKGEAVQIYRAGVLGQKEALKLGLKPNTKIIDLTKTGKIIDITSSSTRALKPSATLPIPLTTLKQTTTQKNTNKKLNKIVDNAITGSQTPRRIPKPSTTLPRTLPRNANRRLNRVIRRGLGKTGTRPRRPTRARSPIRPIPRRLPRPQPRRPTPRGRNPLRNIARGRPVIRVERILRARPVSRQMLRAYRPRDLPRTPRLPPPKLELDEKKLKKKKKSKLTERLFKFEPSLVAIDLKIFGKKKPKILTGLEIRKILK